MAAEMLKERLAPRGAGFRVTECVELEDCAGEPELLQQLVGKGEQLDVGLRFAGADDLGVELVKLAKPSLLRPLVTESRSMGGNLHRSELLPAFAQIGAAYAGGELRPQRDRFA